MRSSFLVSALTATATLSQISAATICFGRLHTTLDQPEFNAAWIQGNEHDAQILSNRDTGGSPCGITFSLDESGSHSNYDLEGCGGPVWLNKDNALDSSCVWARGNVKSAKGGFFVWEDFCCG